jgi:hypothetical protein
MHPGGARRPSDPSGTDFSLGPASFRSAAPSELPLLGSSRRRPEASQRPPEVNQDSPDIADSLLEFGHFSSIGARIPTVVCPLLPGETTAKLRQSWLTDPPAPASPRRRRAHRATGLGQSWPPSVLATVHLPVDSQAGVLAPGQHYSLCNCAVERPAYFSITSSIWVLPWGRTGPAQ